MKSSLWKKQLSLSAARALSHEFCIDFKIDDCEIYLVDRISDALGVYVPTTPTHILIDWNAMNRIGILMHELTHHLEHQEYVNVGESSHGPSYQLAKRKVIIWAKANISSKAPWHHPLRAYQIKSEQNAFFL